MGTSTPGTPVGLLMHWTGQSERKSKKVASALHRDSSHGTLNTELDSKEHQNGRKSMKHLQLSHIIMLPSNGVSATDHCC